MEITKINYPTKIPTTIFKEWVSSQKITLIGAGGKIGGKTINNIFSQTLPDQNIELVLIGSGSKDSLTRLSGLMDDINMANKNKNIRVIITNDYSYTKDSHIAISTVGKWPTPQEMEEFKKIDPTGRECQSFSNAKIIERISKELEKNCPETVFLIVTNQVDTMCAIARKSAPKMHILGLSGEVDFMKLQQIFKEDLNIVLDSGATIIGYHNGTMTPALTSIKNSNALIFPKLVNFAKNANEMENRILFEVLKNPKKEIDVLNKIIEKNLPLRNEINCYRNLLQRLRNFGGGITNKQRAGLPDNTPDTGASFGPAAGITRFIKANREATTYIQSYNAIIENINIAENFGVKKDTALSIPLSISKKGIKEVEIELLPFEKLFMLSAQKELNEKISNLENILKNDSSVIKY